MLETASFWSDLVLLCLLAAALRQLLFVSVRGM